MPIRPSHRFCAMLRQCVPRVQADKAEYVLGLLRAVTEPPRLRGDDAEREYERELRQHFKRVCDRVGLDMGRLPQSGFCSSGISGEEVEVDKDWVSGDARHRLRKMYVQGHEIILLERMNVADGSELRYQVGIFSGESEGPAEVSVPVGGQVGRNAPVREKR